jgi:hypothetical protein
MLSVEDCDGTIMITEDNQQVAMFLTPPDAFELHKMLSDLIEKWDIADKTPEAI